MSVRNLFTKAELRKPVTRAHIKRIKESGLAVHLSANQLRIRFIKVLLAQGKVADAVEFLTPEEIEHYGNPAPPAPPRNSK